MNPYLISMSLAPPIAILPNLAYHAARPETTALWYIALISILPSVTGVVMVLFHIVGVEASLQLGRLILDFGRGACRQRPGTGAQAHVFTRKDIRKCTPRQTSPMIHGIHFFMFWPFVCAFWQLRFLWRSRRAVVVSCADWLT